MIDFLEALSSTAILFVGVLFVMYRLVTWSLDSYESVNPVIPDTVAEMWPETS